MSARFHSTRFARPFPPPAKARRRPRKEPGPDRLRRFDPVKVHEFQAKEMLARFGVTVPRGEAVRTAEEAVAAAARLGGRVVVKAQIHAGGRGKGIAHDARTGDVIRLPGEDKPLGGVRVAADAKQAGLIAGALLGSILKTVQTGPDGRLVQRLLVEEALDIEKEYYVGLVVDRDSRRLVVMASREG